MSEQPWKSDGMCVYTGDGGFDIRNLPNPVERAALIVKAVNSHEALVEALRRVLDLTDGDRPTVNRDNAFEHFHRMNKTLVDIREIAREALGGEPRAVVGQTRGSPDA